MGIILLYGFDDNSAANCFKAYLQELYGDDIGGLQKFVSSFVFDDVLTDIDSTFNMPSYLSPPVDPCT